MNQKVQWIGLPVFVCVCLAAGGLGAIATTPAIDTWYETINKPSWNPPNQIFGPVWTTLFIMMGWAAWLVWKSDPLPKSVFPLSLFGFQLALNIAWSWIFFGWRQPGWAFLEIVLLWLAILATVIVFFRRSWIAGTMLLPYLGWVSFACALNFTIWRLNL